MMTLPLSSVGSFTVVMSVAGPPADIIAPTIRRIASCEARFAAGWGLKTTALPAAIMLMELLMTVDVGLVEGVMEPITPKGACSMSIMPLSPVSHRVTRSSMPGVRRLTSRFFCTLSATRPYPVSSWASRARYSALSMPALRMAAISSPRFSSVISESCACAALALATASSAVSHSQRPVQPSVCGGAAGTSSFMDFVRLRTISSVICLICCSVNAMAVFPFLKAGLPARGISEPPKPARCAFLRRYPAPAA